MQLELGHSAIVLVAPERVGSTAQQVASLAAEAGYVPVVISGDTPPDRVSAGAADLVFVVEMTRGAVTDRTATSLKHLADQPRSRVGILLPSGETLWDRLDIHCSFVVVSHEDFRLGWDPAFKHSVEYYSVLDTSRLG
jgi:hypothetical protein